MGENSIRLAGEEHRIVESLTNLPNMRTWLCESSGRRMHLRMMTGGSTDDVFERSQKIREVATGSGLVVPLETGEQDGQVYALRAWVDAEPFDAFSKRFRFSPKRQEHALNVGVKLSRAVEGLHHAGLSHGALKNANLFFQKDGSPIVTDPVLAGDAAMKVDPREDVRALGLILCRLYTGKPSLVINDYTLMMLAKARVPRQLLRVLWQAIHEDPGMRFPDAATLGRALREVPLPEYQRTVQVRALPDNLGPSDGMPAWLRNTAILVGIVGLIAFATWFLGKVEIPNTPSSAQATANSNTPQAEADFWELPVPGSQPIRMRRLPAFEAMLGDDAEPNSSRRMLRVDQPFSIGTTEVTRGQFAAFVAATGYQTTAETAGGDPNRQVWVVESDRIRPRPEYNWRQPGFTQSDDHPVTSVSWHDTKAFCDWLAQQTGQRVRLPSEAEWEYAARAGSTSKFWWGDDPTGAQGKENVMDQSVKSIFPSRNTAPWDDGFAHTSPVGSFEANPIGIHDMFGNVWEWTADDWNRNASAKTFRGAGFDSWPPKSAAYRFGNAATMGSNLRGFRIVVEGGATSTTSAAPSSVVQPTLRQEARASQPPVGVVQVTYYRFDNAYDRPGLWVWSPDHQDTIQAREVFPSSTTSEGAVFEIRLADLGIQGQPGERIGIIPRLRSSWDLKDGTDRFWTPALGNTIWLVQGENTIYTHQPVLEPAVRRALLEDERTVRFITNRALNDAILSNARAFSISTSNGGLAPSRVLPVRDGTGAVVSALATFPSSLYPLPSGATAGIQGMQPAPLLLGALQKDPSIFSIDEPMGVTFTGTDAHFRVFSPNAERLDVEVFSNPSAATPSRTVSMMRDVNGGWEATLPRAEAEGSYYTYSVQLAGEGQPTHVADPAAINHVGRSDRTRITAPRSTDPPFFMPIQRPAFSGEMKDAVIYELQVQGFTAGGGTTHRMSGKYLGLVEAGTTLSSDRSVTTGLDHLKELGVTHVQLMPVSQFVPAPGSKDGYDWGYWPLAWMSPRGDFASSEDGDARLREFKQMVQRLHAEGIGVIVDLPLAQLSVQSSIEVIAPGAYTFMEANGRAATIADQAYRIDSSAPAARALMLQTVRFWMEEMGADGVRIEALGHIDKATAEAILATARDINPAALVYGTPWGTGASPHGQTTDKAMLAGTGVAAYNDTYRDTLKGSPSGNNTGFVQEPRRLARNVERLIAGSIDAFATSSNDVLNLLTDHDGCTLWDKLAATTNLPEQERMKLHLLAQGILLVSQGGVLLNGGDELLWSRNGQCWGWEAGLQVNTTPWANKARYRFATEYLAGLIALRRDHPVFRLGTAEEIRRRVRFLPPQQLPDPTCIAFTIEGNGLEGESWSSVFVIFNPTAEAQSLRLPGAQTWSAYVENGRASTSPLSVANGQVQVPGRTMAVLAR